MLSVAFSLALIACEPPEPAVPPAPEPAVDIASDAAGSGAVTAAMTDQAIQDAIRKVLDEDKERIGILPLDPQADFRGSGPYAKFAKDFAYARIPSCIGAGHSNALKFQEPRIGPIVFGGLLALPFLAVAAVRGKCN